MSATTPAHTSSPTPILDHLAPLPSRPKRAWVLVLQLAIGLLIGVAIGLSGIALVDAGDAAKNPFFPLLLLLYVFAAQYLAVIIHECGHLIAGLSAGLRVNYVRFGPLQINPPFRISLRPRTGIGAAGMASLLPGNHDDLHMPACILLLGGPLANIVAASILYLLGRPLSMFWGILALICAIIGVANLFPFVRRGAVSDGKRILMVLRRTRQGERWLAILKLSSDLWKGELPENLDPRSLNAGIQFSDNLPDTAAIHALAHTSAFHKHQDAEAARLLEVALAHSAEVPIASRQSLVAAAAIFQARRAHKLESAQKWLTQLPEKTQWPGLREQAQAAILECQSQVSAAIDKLEESIRLTSTMPAGMQRDVSVRSLERWKNELLEQRRVERPS